MKELRRLVFWIPLHSFPLAPGQDDGAPPRWRWSFVKRSVIFFCVERDVRFPRPSSFDDGSAPSFRTPFPLFSYDRSHRRRACQHEMTFPPPSRCRFFSPQYRRVPSECSPVLCSEKNGNVVFFLKQVPAAFFFSGHRFVSPNDDSKDSDDCPLPPYRGNFRSQ